MSLGDNLFCIVMLIGALLYWKHYLQEVRHPKNSWRYDDSAWCIGNLYLYPYALLTGGFISAAGLLAQLDIPQVVGYWFLKVPMFASIALGFIGLLGAVGVPLPYPLVPKWFVQRRRQEWARSRGRRKARTRIRRERRCLHKR